MTKKNPELSELDTLHLGRLVDRYGRVAVINAVNKRPNRKRGRPRKMVMAVGQLVGTVEYFERMLEEQGDSKPLKHAYDKAWQAMQEEGDVRTRDSFVRAVRRDRAKRLECRTRTKTSI
jgi:hypothetical protein